MAGDIIHISIIRFCLGTVPNLEEASSFRMGTVPKTFFTYACIWHYFPRQGGNLNCAGAHHGNLTPPRISPSCVNRSTIMNWRDHGGTACRNCLGLSGYRSAPYSAVLWCGNIPHRWSSRTRPNAGSVSGCIQVTGYLLFKVLWKKSKITPFTKRGKLASFTRCFLVEWEIS